jgi:8-oxo-dGTP pyrophosphatase MutT (NUDIX family)
MKRGIYRKGIFILVYSKTKKGIEYLILKRKLHWIGWEFPKGGIEKNENVIASAERELKEETGLHPRKIKKFNIKGKYYYDKEYPDRPGFKGQTYTLFVAEVKKGKVKLDKKEHSAYKWLGFKEALKKLRWTNQKKCLKVVNKWLKNN